MSCRAGNRGCLHGIAFHCAVLIILPSDPNFPPASIHDISVRVGKVLPSLDDDLATINTPCKYTPGQLGTERGQIIRVQCENGPIAGRVVTIQIRWDWASTSTCLHGAHRRRQKLCAAL